MAKQKLSSNTSGKSSEAAEPKRKKNPTIFTFIGKVSIAAIIVIAFVLYSDYKGFFNPDYANDHTYKKWNAFYEFTEKHPVDIVMVGNSHLYTGINPENLSNALGMNAFILASPGTNLSDAYYALKEAVKVSKPKIAIVETFSISNYESKKLKNAPLTDQFRSFKARKDVVEKLKSTPELFNSDNFVAAWSNTIRNHDFIFKDTKQLKTNQKINKSKKPKKTESFLGRYIRFKTGLEDSTLKKYDRPDFKPFNFEEILASEDAIKYIHKTIQLCKENDIKLVFLTLPVYYKHYENYDVYKKNIIEILGNEEVAWLDLQEPYNHEWYGPDCFENTLDANQHLTYNGSMVSTYRLAEFLQAKFPETIVSRSQNADWISFFKGSDGYFENFPVENDGVNILYMRDSFVPERMNFMAKEVSLVTVNKMQKFIIKVNKKDNPSLYKRKINIVVEALIENKKVVTSIEAICQHFYDFKDYYVFSSGFLGKNVKVQGLVSLELLPENAPTVAPATK